MSAPVDPALLQQMAANARTTAAATDAHVTAWTIDPGTKACLLRDRDDADAKRILFIRETGRVSMWLTPQAPDIAAKLSAAQAYQLYFVPLGTNAPQPTVSEFGAALWQEPLAKTGRAGLAIQADPTQLLAKYPGGLAIVLAQGERSLVADVIRPDLLAALAELKKCRGGR